MKFRKHLVIWFFIVVMVYFLPHVKIEAQMDITDFPATFSQIFPDQNLAIAISQRFERSVEDTVTEVELKSNFRLYNLDISNLNITNLEGLQYVAITQLTARNNQITDLSPLNNITNLRQIILDGNPITDVSNLGVLPNLQSISLNNALVEDLIFTQTYPNVQTINLMNTQIASLFDLSVSLPNLRTIYISETPFYDLSDLLPLADSLLIIDISKTQVRDFSVLTEFSVLSNFMSADNPLADYDSFPLISNLALLNLSGNQLSNLNFLKNYTSIPTLMLNDNDISSPEVLENIQVGYLYLNGNDITDATWIMSLTKVLDIFIEKNHISDISFLENTNQFRRISIQNQIIQNQPLHLGKDTYLIYPNISFFPGFQTTLYENDIPQLYKSLGIYDEIAGTITWNNIQPHSELSFIWNMYTQGTTITYSGTFVQPISEIGFDVNYYDEDTLYDSKTQVHEGSYLEKPADPVKKDHYFMGWYQNSDFTLPWDFSTDRLTTHTALYARFEAIEYHTITVDRLDGNVPSEYIVEAGQKFDFSEIPIREHHIFQGWYLDLAFKKAWDFDNNVENSFTLYAKWEKMVEEINYHIVKLDMLNNDPPVEYMVAAGSKFEIPETPIKDGYRFLGWYLDSHFQEAWNFDNTVENSFTLYAKWESDITSNTKQFKMILVITLIILCDLIMVIRHHHKTLKNIEYPTHKF